MSKKQDVKLYVKTLILFLAVLAYCVTVYVIEESTLSKAVRFMPETELAMTQMVRVWQTSQITTEMITTPATSSHFRPGHFAHLAEHVRELADSLQDMQSSILFGEGKLPNSTAPSGSTNLTKAQNLIYVCGRFFQYPRIDQAVCIA